MRIRALDAIRGAAMVAVCVSHSSQFAGPRLGAQLWTLGLVATPSFLLVSGFVCAYLAAAHETRTAFRWQLLDRAVFLLLVVHVALGASSVAWRSVPGAVIGSFYVTDAVAVGLIVATWAAFEDSKRVAMLGVLLYMSAWMVSTVIELANDSILARLLFGMGGGARPDGTFVVPLAPYLGIFLLGVAGGRAYVLRRGALSNRQVARVCFAIGVVAVVAGVAIKIAALLLKPHLASGAQALLYRFSEPRQKIPPSVTYLLTFGGLGVSGAGLVFVFEARGIARRLLVMLATLGRASLVTFVSQSWIFFLLSRTLRGDPSPRMWLVVFPASIVLVWLIAAAWDRRSFNRLLTLGVRRLKIVQPAAAADGRRSIS